MERMVKDNNSFSNIVVVGMGVVGLPAALLLANAGYQVFGVDINKTVIDALNSGVLPPHVKEQELESLLKNPKVYKNLHFQLVPGLADAFIIAVPTPVDLADKKADMSFVRKACESIVPFLRSGNLVIIESTIPPLTCRNFVRLILEKSGLKVGKDISLAHCPERVLPGNIYDEIVNNDRIIGGVDDKSCQLAEEVYASFVKGNIYKTDDVSAELCKLMENSYRDVNIALANELAQVVQNLGVNPKKVINLANKHPRVNILNPGIGVGGHCIPIDPWFIYEVDPRNSQLIALSRKINDRVPSKVVKFIKEQVKGIKNPQIIALGVSYKPDTADTRESPALEVVRILTKMGFEVSHLDPLVEGYKYSKSLAEECKNKDLLVVLVPHQIVINELNKDKDLIKKTLSTHKILQF